MYFTLMSNYFLINQAGQIYLSAEIVKAKVYN